MSLTRRVLIAASAIAAIAFTSTRASATAASGTVAVTATVVSSVSLTFVSDAAGITLGGTGTSAASVSFGSVQAYGGGVPVGVTKTVNAPTNWSLSTPLDVVVQVANQSSATYTLTASLAAADATNTWQLGATTITNVSSTLTAVGAYGSTPYTFKLTIPFSEAAGAISNTINFTATAN